MQVNKFFNFDSSPRFPRFLIILFCVEMCERFSYYGLRALLVNYFKSEMYMSDSQTYFIYSVFAALGYAIPIIGGIIADRSMGFIKMVFFGATFITLGHFCMFFSRWYQDVVFLGLSFIALGTGLFKGNITNLLGGCYGKEHEEKRAGGFTIFYVSINLGSFIASIACGYAKFLWGWHVAFSLAGFVMLIGFIIFNKYKFVFASIDSKFDSKSRSLFTKKDCFFLLLSSVVAIFMCAIFKFSNPIQKNLSNISSSMNILISCLVILFIVFFIYNILKSVKLKIERNNLLVLFIFMVFFMIFFACEMHLGSLFILFIERHTSGFLFGIPVPSEVSQAINPCVIMIVGTFLGRVIISTPKSDVRNFFLGMLTISIFFVFLYWGTLKADSNSNTHYFFPFIAVVFMSIGELLVSPFMQAKTTELSPQQLKGLMMGTVMGSLSISNILGGFVFSKMFSVGESLSKAESLLLYQEGFLNSFKIYGGVLLVFVLMIPLIYKLLKESRIR